MEAKSFQIDTITNPVVCGLLIRIYDERSEDHMKRSYFLMAGFLAVLTLAVAIPAHAVDPNTLYVRYIDGAVGLSEAGSP